MMQTIVQVFNRQGQMVANIGPSSMEFLIMLCVLLDAIPGWTVTNNVTCGACGEVLAAVHPETQTTITCSHCAEEVSFGT